MKIGLYSIMFALLSWGVFLSIDDVAYLPTSIDIEIFSKNNDIFQIFYDTGHGFNENQKIIRVYQGNQKANLKFIINGVKIKRLRIDVCEGEGQVSISKIEIRQGGHVLKLLPEELSSKLVPLGNISDINNNNGTVNIVSIKDDPRIMLAEPVDKLIEYELNAGVLALAGLFVLIIVILCGIGLYEKFVLKNLKNKSIMHNENREFHLIAFTKPVLAVLFIFLLSFVLLTIFKVHYSSIGCYDVLPDNVESSVILGTPKSIRSDEWVVQTPLILSQAEKGFPVENISVGPLKSPLISASNLPVKHYTTLFRIQHWGFFLFGRDHGFSFYWNFKLFALAASAFLLFLIITRNNIVLSLFGAMWLVFSGFTQWWFSICLPELLISSFMIIISFVYLIQSRKISHVIISGIVLFSSMISMLMLMYLPWQIALSMFIICILSVIAVDNYRTMTKNVFLHFKVKIISLILVGIMFSVVCIMLYCELKETIITILNTAYPGKRIVHGGGTDLFSYFSGFYGFFNKQNRFPSFLWNVCETSRFIMLAPLVIIMTLYSQIRRREVHAAFWIIAGFLLVFSVWQIFGFPQIIAKFTMFNKIPESRAFLPVGLSGLFMVIYYFGKEKVTEKLKGKIVILFLSILLFALFSYVWNLKAGKFLSLKEMVFITAVFSLIFISIIYRNRILLIGGILIAVMPNLFVNPVCSGLSSLDSFQIISKVKEISAFDHSAKWIVFGSDICYPQLVKASGVDVINGVNYIPNKPFMKALEGDRNLSDIYNRYAHVLFVAADNENAEFNLEKGDKFSIEIRPDSKILKQQNVKYILIPAVDMKSKYRFKKKLTMVPLDGFDIYEL